MIETSVMKKLNGLGRSSRQRFSLTECMCDRFFLSASISRFHRMLTHCPKNPFPKSFEDPLLQTGIKNMTNIFITHDFWNVWLNVRRVTWLCVIFWCHYEMMENNRARLTATSVHSHKLKVTTKHFWRKTFARQKQTLWIKLDMKIKFWHTCRLLRLNPGARGNHLSNQLSWEAA